MKDSGWAAWLYGASLEACAPAAPGGGGQGESVWGGRVSDVPVPAAQFLET